VSTWRLLNTVRIGTSGRQWAGDLVNDEHDDVERLRAEGAILWPAGGPEIEQAARVALKRRRNGADTTELSDLMISAACNDVLGQAQENTDAIGNLPAAAGLVVDEIVVTPASPSLQVLRAMQAGDEVVRAIVIVETQFDGAPTLAISTSHAQILKPNESDLRTLAQYGSDIVTRVASDDLLQLQFAAGGATVGAARVLIEGRKLA